MFEMLMAKLPELAQAIAQPLSKVDKITLVSSGDGGALGASKITGEVAKILAQMPEVIESLSGVDVRKMIEQLPQGGKKGTAKKDEAKEGETKSRSSSRSRSRK
jgi:flotillin